MGRPLLGPIFLFTSLLLGAPRAESRDILIAFEYKGPNLPWDLGVTEHLAQVLDLGKVDRFIFSGSSSGALPTAFFACHGFSRESLKRAREIGEMVDVNAFENLGAIAFKVIKHLNGADVFLPDNTILPLMNFVTNDQTCVPTHPFAIAASNGDVLHDSYSMAYSSAGEKRLDFDTMNVFDKKSGQMIGKGCTYFTNEAGAAYLRRIPAKQRLCDLRIIKDAKDLVLAIRASIAEPYFFRPLQEPSPSSLESESPVRSREYHGGFVMPAVVQDFKRAAPDTLAIGTGRYFFVRLANRFVKNAYLIDMNQRLLETNWWYDYRIDVDFATNQRQMFNRFPASDLMEQAKAKARSCHPSCLPALYQQPSYLKNDSGLAQLSKQRGRGLDGVLAH